MYERHPTGTAESGQSSRLPASLPSRPLRRGISVPRRHKTLLAPHSFLTNDAARSRVIPLANYLGLKRPVLLLLAAVMLVGLGEKLFERFLPKYLETLGGAALLIGALGAVQNMVTALCSLPGGYLSERFGYRRALQGFTGLAMSGYLLTMLVPHWSTLFVGMIFFTSWSALALPAIMALFGDVLGREQRAMGLSMHSIIRGLPMALGPVLGGLFIGVFGIQTGIRIAMGCSFVLGAAALCVLRRLPAKSPTPYEPLHALTLWRRMDPRLKTLLVPDILIHLCEQIPYVFVVLWCLNIVRTTPEQFGILTALEIVVAMLLYIPVAHFSDRCSRKPFVLLTFVLFTAFPVVLFFSRSLPLLIVAFVVRGLKEFGEPSRKALIVDLADPGANASTVGLYYLARDLVVALGALFGGWLWSLDPAWNLWAASGCGLLGTLVFAGWREHAESAGTARSVVGHREWRRSELPPRPSAQAG